MGTAVMTCAVAFSSALGWKAPQKPTKPTKTQQQLTAEYEKMLVRIEPRQQEYLLRTYGGKMPPWWGWR